MTSATSSLPIAIPPDVQTLAVDQGVATYLPAVLEMTARVFPEGLRDVQVDLDPEVPDDRHILVVVKASNLDVERGVAARGQWHNELFACCPAPLVCVFRLDLSIAP